MVSSMPSKSIVFSILDSVGNSFEFSPEAKVVLVAVIVSF